MKDLDACRAKPIVGTLEAAEAAERASLFRAVVANRHDGAGVVLWTGDYNMAEEVSNCGPQLSDLGLDDAPEGISIWEGRIITQECGNPLDGPDYETHLKGEFRRPNEHEWARILAGVSPWEKDIEEPSPSARRLRKQGPFPPPKFNKE